MPNTPAVTMPSREKVHSSAEIFQEVAARCADRPAVRHGAAQWTYADIADAAGGVAGWLRERGVGRGDVVATVLDRSERPVVCSLAAWAVGAAYVHLDPADPDQRLAALMEQARPRAILTDRRNHDRLSGTPRPRLVIDDPRVRPRAYEVDQGLARDDLAYLVFTSGSTGTPKAVGVEHRPVLNHHAAIGRFRAAIEIGSFGLTATFATDFGLDCVIGALLTGARLDVYAPSMLLDPVAFAAELAEHPVDMLVYTPTLLEALSQAADLAAFLPNRVLVVAGEAFPPRLAQAIVRVRPDLPTFNSYGPSEATIEVTQHRVRPADVHRSTIPIGRPLDGVTLRVLDEHGQPVPDGVAGVLHIGGQCLARGYVNDPSATARTFQVSESGERLYRTDDIVRLNADGNYEFLGRSDRQVKIRGHRVEPGEVETALLAQPEIRRALVTAEPVAAGTPADLVAYLVVEPPVSPADITRRLTSVVAAALIPSRIHLVATIPITPNGKADLPALRAMTTTGPRPAAAVTVHSATERTIAAAWRKVLGRAKVDRDERFLEAGGNSLKVLQLFGELRHHYPAMTVADLFRYPTVAALAQALTPAEEPRLEVPVQVVLDL
jgi:amino acid adenylation domain-containing protein